MNTHANAANSTPRQEEILAQAMELLREGSLARLTTRRIAERIGFTEGAFFRHFPTKQALLIRLMDKLEEMLLDPIRAIAGDESLAVHERLQRIVGHHIRLVREQNSLPILLLAEASASGEKPLMDRMRQLMSRYRGLVAKLIRQGQANGEVDLQPDADCLTLGLIGLSAVLAIQHRLHPNARLENRFEKTFAPWVVRTLTETEEKGT